MTQLIYLSEILKIRAKLLLVVQDANFTKGIPGVESGNELFELSFPKFHNYMRYIHVWLDMLNSIT